MSNDDSSAAVRGSGFSAGLGGTVPERAKQRVLNAYPKAYASRDVDGFWHVWCPSVRGALSGGQQDTRSAATAWKWAAKRLTPNAEFTGPTRQDQ